MFSQKKKKIDKWSKKKKKYNKIHNYFIFTFKIVYIKQHNIYNSIYNNNQQLFYYTLKITNIQ